MTGLDTPEAVIAAAQADPFTQSVLASGAVSAPVDIDALMKNLAAMQARVASLEAERGIPSDMIAAHVKNLADHVDARAAGNPTVDMSEIKATIAKLPENSQDVTPQHTDYLRELVHALVDGNAAKELGYLKQLVTDLHLSVLKQLVPAL